MSTSRFQVVPAAYVVLLRKGESGQEVLLQQRSGTGFMDGWWACAAAGHVEAGESAPAAAVREAAEEIGVELSVAQLRLLATVHRTCALHNDPVEERMDIFFGARRWEGTPEVLEPEKSASLEWFPLRQLPERTVPHERRVIQAIASGHTPTLLTHGFDQQITLIAAVGADGSLGDGSSMPWHLPEDLQLFKQETMGGVLIMGRRTWDSIGQALPGRRTIVVTRDRGWQAAGAEVAHSLPEALLGAGDDQVYVAGGGEIYEQTIEHAHRLVISEVRQSPGSAVRFPTMDSAVWREASRQAHEGFDWVEYTRS